MKSLVKNISGGPGKVTESLGIRVSHTNVSLLGKEIWIEDKGLVVSRKEITVSKRIGVDYAGEDALLPYRFVFHHQAS